MKDIYYDLRKILLSDDKEDLEDLYFLLQDNYKKTICKIKKLIFIEIYNKDINNLIKIFVNLNTTIHNERNTKYLSRIVRLYSEIMYKINRNKEFTYVSKLLKNSIENILLKNNNICIKNDYDLFNFLILKTKNYQLIKYIILSKTIKLDDYFETGFFDIILNKFLNVENLDIGELKYLEKILILLISNVSKEQLIINKNKYIEIISNSKYINNIYIKRIYDIVNKNCNITLSDLEKDYNINFNFSLDILNEANSLKLDYNPCNFTKQEVITIDGINTYCIDDGFYIEKLKNGNYYLYIHIADIPSIILNNSSLDNLAYKKASSLYLIDINIPMFPNNITNDLSSLKKGELRNVITYRIELDSNFNFIGNNINDYFKIYRSKINVSHQLSYCEADEILKRDKMFQLKALYNLSEKLKKDNPKKVIYRNIQNDFDKINNNVKIKESIYSDISPTSNIVQESMVLANRLLAEYFEYNDYPMIYRNNKPLTSEKLLLETKIIKENIRFNSLSLKNLDYNKVLNIFDIISKKGYYSLNNEGHYGLGFHAYSHNTSPIRRYSDVICQRLIYDFVFNKNKSNALFYEWENKIRDMCEYLNEKEEENYMFESEYNFLAKRKLLKKDN